MEYKTLLSIIKCKCGKVFIKYSQTDLCYECDREAQKMPMTEKRRNYLLKKGKQ